MKKCDAKTFKLSDQVTSDRVTIANAFCSFFTEIGSKLQKTIVRLENITWKAYCFRDLMSKVNPLKKNFCFRNIEVGYVTNILKSTKLTKCAGLDNIPPRLIKDGAAQIAVPLTALINRSLYSGIFPTTEKEAKISPVHKNESKSVLDNYRPISVLNIFSKVIERAVYDQLSEYLEQNNMLSNNQYGFRPKRSTNHAVTILIDDIRTGMDRGMATGAVFLDLRKAFDTVHHSCLLEKLPVYGIEGYELLWFQDYLFNRTQVVRFDGVLSEAKHITHGVPQGSILGPLLFTIMINDLDQVLKQTKILLYADDTVIYCSGKEHSTIQDVLNSELDMVTDWLFQNNLILNLKKGKTDFILFGTQQKLRRMDKVVIVLNRTPVNEAESYEYLGVHLDRYLTLHEHMHKIYKRSLTRVKLLKRIRHTISPTIALKIYKVMIQPIMTYCSTLYLGLPPTQINKLQKVHEKAMQIVDTDTEIPPILEGINTMFKRKAAVEVFRCLHKLGPGHFDDYFTKTAHTYNTRGNDSSLQLPKIKTEAGKRSFMFQGSLIFNKLPKDV